MEEKKKAEEQQQREEVIAALKEGKKPYIPKKCNLFCICKKYFIYVIFRKQCYLLLSDYNR